MEEILKGGHNANFIGTAFTAKHFRREHLITSLLDRRSLESWTKAGLKDIAHKANERAKKLLKEHVTVPMEKEVSADIQAYVNVVSKAYGY